MKNLIGIGNSGEYFVAGELERRGFSVAIPMSNTPVFDILAVLKSNDDNDSCKQTYKQIIVQVKTINGNGNEWTMSAKDEKINAENAFYILVRLNGFNTPDYYILPSKTVSNVIKESHEKWINAMGKRGQPHKNTGMRKLKLKDLPNNGEGYLNKWSILS